MVGYLCFWKRFGNVLERNEETTIKYKETARKCMTISGTKWSFPLSLLGGLDRRLSHSVDCRGLGYSGSNLALGMVCQSFSRGNSKKSEKCFFEVLSSSNLSNIKKHHL